jgi:hypothetical protein
VEECVPEGVLDSSAVCLTSQSAHVEGALQSRFHAQIEHRRQRRLPWPRRDDTRLGQLGRGWLNKVSVGIFRFISGLQMPSYVTH